MLNSERKFAHFCSEWGIVGYGTRAFWNLWIRSFDILQFHRLFPYSNSKWSIRVQNIQKILIRRCHNTRSVSHWSVHVCVREMDHIFMQWFVANSAPSQYMRQCLFIAIWVRRNTHQQLNEELTHWGRDKTDAISQTPFSNTFSWMKMYEFRLRFHWSLSLRFELTIFQHWFR